MCASMRKVLDHIERGNLSFEQAVHVIYRLYAKEIIGLADLHEANEAILLAYGQDRAA